MVKHNIKHKILHHLDSIHDLLEESERVRGHYQRERDGEEEYIKPHSSHHELKAVKVHLTEKQAKNLLSGKGVRLDHKNLKGKHTIHIREELHKKLHKARRDGMGVVLKLQHPHEIRMTGGTLSDVFKKIGKFYTEKLKPIIGPAIRSGLKGLAKYGVNALSDIIPDEDVSDFVRKEGRRAAPGLIDLAADELGLGLRKRGRPRKYSSGGSFLQSGY